MLNWVLFKNEYNKSVEYDYRCIGLIFIEHGAGDAVNSDGNLDFVIQNRLDNIQILILCVYYPVRLR